jgi:hypothetical protein
LKIFQLHVRCPPPVPADSEPGLEVFTCRHVHGDTVLISYKILLGLKIEWDIVMAFAANFHFLQSYLTNQSAMTAL